MKHWLYGLLTAGIESDLTFYTTGASPLLELGCGLGRVLIPCAQNSIECWGLDNDAEALAILKENTSHLPQSIHLVQGDMSHFSLDQTFAQIQIPLRSFQLLQPEYWVSCLRSCANHLQPKGKLYLHLSPDLDKNHSGAWHIVGSRESTDGGWFLIEEAHQIQSKASLLCHRVSHILPNGNIQQQWLMRHTLYHLSLETLKLLLKESGLQYDSHSALDKDWLITAVNQS